MNLGQRGIDRGGFVMDRADLQNVPALAIPIMGPQHPGRRTSGRGFCQCGDGNYRLMESI
jgi:hypothetical protein